MSDPPACANCNAYDQVRCRRHAPTNQSGWVPVPWNYLCGEYTTTAPGGTCNTCAAYINGYCVRKAPTAQSMCAPCLPTDWCVDWISVI